MTKIEQILALKQVSAALHMAEQEMYDLEHAAIVTRLHLNEAHLNLSAVMACLADEAAE